MRAYVANVEFVALVVGFAVIWAASPEEAERVAARMAPGQFDVWDIRAEPVEVRSIERVVDDEDEECPNVVAENETAAVVVLDDDGYPD